MSKNIRRPSYQHMLAKLREAREQAQLRQVEVALLLGKAQSYVSRVETGERRIDPIELAEFAVLYQVSLTDLLPALPVIADEIPEPTLPKIPRPTDD